MAKMENTFAWGRSGDADVSHIEAQVNQNKEDILQLNNNQTELWDYLDNQYITDKKINKWIKLTDGNISFENDTDMLVDVNFTLPENVVEFAFVGRFYQEDSTTFFICNGIYPNVKDNLFVPCFVKGQGQGFIQIQGNSYTTKRIRCFGTNGSPLVGKARQDNFYIIYKVA